MLKWFITVPGITVSKEISALLLKAIIRCNVLIRRNKNLFISRRDDTHGQKMDSHNLALRSTF